MYDVKLYPEKYRDKNKFAFFRCPNCHRVTLIAEDQYNGTFTIHCAYASCGFEVKVDLSTPPAVAYSP